MMDPKKLDFQYSLNRHKLIFNNKQSQQQNINFSLETEQKQDNHSFFKKISNFFINFNLCLRPEIQSPQLKAFLQNYEVDSLYQDPYYGECYALRLKQGERYINLRRSVFNNSRQKQHFQRIASLRHYVSLTKQRLSKRQYKQRREILEQMSRYSGSQQNVLHFTIISELEKQQFIFTSVELYIAHDFILVDLEKEFENRIIQKRCFTESEINIIMKKVCSGLVALENTNYKSIRMSYVYFCQYGKQIKLAHPKMFNYKSNLQTITYNYKQKGIYLSPEELYLLQNNEIQLNRQNIELPNAFTFGMMVLSLMCNKYLNQVYNYRSCQINFVHLQEIINNLGSQFSEGIISTVKKLLKPQLHERLSLRSLMNILEEKYELTQNVEITLIKQNVTQEISQADKFSHYHPVFEQEAEQPQHKNYLYGMVYPKIGIQAQYYHQTDNTDPFRKTSFFDNSLNQTDAIIANHRYNYQQLNSKYLGDAVVRDHLRQQPLKQGLGLYILSDGQSYQGQWKNNQMHGYGKLYYPANKIRYEGNFEKGMFNGFGTQYSYQQIPQREEQIDKTFVRLHKGSWLKYEGRFKNDKREGPGKAFFKNGIWVGNFKDGQPNGHGLWEANNGQKVKGIWQDGVYTKSG